MTRPSPADQMASTDPNRSGAGDGPVPSGLLRRLDWRFLVPLPALGRFRRLVLLGGSEDLADSAVRVGLATEAVLALPDDRSADAIAVLAGADPTVEAVARAVALGGVVYWETDRRRRGCRRRTPARLQRALEEVGIHTVGRYAVRPGFDRSELYLPLDEPAPLRWYLSSVYSARRPVQLAGEMAVRCLTGLDGRRLARIAPLHALVGVLGTAGPGASTALERAVAVGLAPGGGSPVLVNHGGDRVVVLAFPLRGRAPATVLKIPKQPAFVARTRHEQDVMSTVRASLGPGAAEAVPRPMGTADLGPGMPAAAETAAPGRSLARLCGRWGTPRAARIEHLQLAAGWIEALHRDAPGAEGIWDAEARQRWLEEPVARFVERFGARDAEVRLFEAASARSLELDGVGLPIVWQHRDYTVWNLFRDGDRLHVLDWEGAEPGLPVCDLLRFVTHWHELARGLLSEPERTAGLRELFCSPAPSSPATAAARAAIDRYVSAVGTPAGLTPVLLVLSWVELCLRRSVQQRDGGEAPADARDGNENLAYLAELAAGVDHLFPGRHR